MKKQFKTFVKVDDGNDLGGEYFYRTDDLLVGYENDLTYKIPKEKAVEIWGKNPGKKIAAVCSDSEKIKEVEKKYSVSFQEWELRNVQYNVSTKYDPSYFWQEWMKKAQLHISEENFFSYDVAHSKKHHLYGVDLGQYGIVSVAIAEEEYDLQFLERVRDLETTSGIEEEVNWLEKWRDELGEYVFFEVKDIKVPGFIKEYRIYPNS